MAAPEVREFVAKGKPAPVPVENMSREEPLPVDGAGNKDSNSDTNEAETDGSAIEPATGEADVIKENGVTDCNIITDLPDSNSHADSESIDNGIITINGLSPDTCSVGTLDTRHLEPVNMTQDVADGRHETNPALPRISEILSEPASPARVLDNPVLQVQPKPPYKGVMVPCGQLKQYLDSLSTFNRKCMLRKGREVHKIYVDLSKGETFLDDQFSYTEFGKMVLTNGSIRAGRAKNAKQIVVARETLYCSGTTACKRACGGYGSCLPGCDKTKMRGHRCSYRIKLTQRLGFVNHWFVEELGSHGQFGKDKSEPPSTTSDIVKQAKAVTDMISTKTTASKPKREIRPLPEKSASHSTNRRYANGGTNSVSDKFTVSTSDISSNYHYVLGLMPTNSPQGLSPPRASPVVTDTQPENFSSPSSSQPGAAEIASAQLAAQTALSVAMATNSIPSQLSSMMPNLPLNIVSYLPQDPSALNPFLVKIKQENGDDTQSPVLYPGLPHPGQIPFSPSQISKSHSPSPSRGLPGSKERSPVSHGDISAAELEKIKSETPQRMQAQQETLGQVHSRLMERAKMRKSSQTVRVPQKNSPVENESSQLFISNLNIPNTHAAHTNHEHDGKAVSDAVLNRFQTLNHILQSKAFQEAKNQLESKKLAGDQQQETALNLTVKQEKPSGEDRNQSPYYKLAEEWKKGEQLLESQPHPMVNGVHEEPVAMETDSPELTDNEKELMCRVRQLESHVKQLQNIVIKKDGGGEEPMRGSRRKKAQRDFDFSKYNTRHVALKVLYLGFDYQGFASQEDTENTIEHVLIDALKRTRLIESRETSCYHRCGRTDKGVSAFSQVMSIDLRSNLLTGVGVKVREGGTAHVRPGDKTTEIRYCYILNKVLPPEIRVLAWAPVNPEFSARFSCKKRTYKYIFPKGNNDIKAMNEAAQKLVGEHDFRNLCKMDVGNGVTNFIRKIHTADLVLLDEGAGGYGMCELTIVGSSFLWHQIRCIVAMLVFIGQQREKPEIINELLDITKNPRKPQYTMASELPLCLYETEFGDDFDWIYEADWHEDNIKTLQQLWAQYSVKSTMVKRMLDDLDKAKVETECDIAPWSDLSPPVESQSDWVLPESKYKAYKPLMSRQTGETLENRIEFYAKKRKLNSGESEGTSAEVEGE